MTNIVDHTFVSSSLPKYLQPLATEFEKPVGYMFESDEQTERFAAGCAEAVDEVAGRRKSPLRCTHTRTQRGGSITVERADLADTCYLRLTYLRVKGHLEVTKDNRQLLLHPYMQ